MFKSKTSISDLRQKNSYLILQMSKNNEDTDRLKKIKKDLHQMSCALKHSRKMTRPDKKKSDNIRLLLVILDT